ncbi:hypothetical protein AMTRI_Chr12g275050 [Amborella trichopoda]
MDWRSLGSLFATFVFVREMIKNYVPLEARKAIKRFGKRFFSFLLLPYVYIMVDEYESGLLNEPYESVQTYLSPKCYALANTLKVTKANNSSSYTFSMDSNQKITDHFNGAPLYWTFHTAKKNSGNRTYEDRYFELTFCKKHREMVSKFYIPHVMAEASLLAMRNRAMRLYTNRATDPGGRIWSPVLFLHPSTFDTLAIDSSMKTRIKNDLMRFVNRKEYYKTVGRAWKRGYLLYGPPGTGKTSLIAAIANFLNFDIYDLELRSVMSNTKLRKLLTSTSSKSIIVVEDIDCSLNSLNRENKAKAKAEEEEEEEEDEEEIEGERGDNMSLVSLSGVLNFVDGLWSSCGGERLMIFTTNHKERLDPALLRPGRMDLHIHLSYCGFEAFKVLAKNYVRLEDHPLMEKVGKALRDVQVTPAEVAEWFMGCKEDPDLAMETLLNELLKRQGGETEGPQVGVEENAAMD